MAPDKELPGVVFEGAIDIFRRIKAASDDSPFHFTIIVI
jgi:hypothetical protein